MKAFPMMFGHRLQHLLGILTPHIEELSQEKTRTTISKLPVVKLTI